MGLTVGQTQLKEIISELQKDLKNLPRIKEMENLIEVREVKRSHQVRSCRRKERKSGAEAILEQAMVENFPEELKAAILQLCEFTQKQD